MSIQNIFIIWTIISLLLWLFLPLIVNKFGIYPYARYESEFEARDNRKRKIMYIVAILGLPITFLILTLFLFFKIIKDVIKG